jgi:hypothetical protein
MGEYLYRSTRAVRMIRSEGQKLSRGAQKFVLWGTFSYKLGLALAATYLVAANTFIAISHENLAVQLMTFIFVGIVPALLTYLIGCLTYWAMKVTSAICDPVVSFCMLLSRILNNIALIGWHFLLRPTIEILRRWSRIVTSILRAWRTVLWTTCRVAELNLAFALVTCAVAFVPLKSLVDKSWRTATHLAVLWMRARISSACMFASISERSLRIACIASVADVQTCGRAILWLTYPIWSALIWVHSAALLVIGSSMQLLSGCHPGVAPLIFQARRRCFTAWRTFVYSITFPVRLAAQVLIRIIPSMA